MIESKVEDELSVGCDGPWVKLGIVCTGSMAPPKGMTAHPFVRGEIHVARESIERRVPEGCISS